MKDECVRETAGATCACRVKPWAVNLRHDGRRVVADDFGEAEVLVGPAKSKYAFVYIDRNCKRRVPLTGWVGHREYSVQMCRK